MRKSDFIGRKIIDVNFNEFDNGRGGRSVDPVFTLDSGQKLYFIVEETEVGSYGIRPYLTKAAK